MNIENCDFGLSILIKYELFFYVGNEFCLFRTNLNVKEEEEEKTVLSHTLYAGQRASELLSNRNN